MAMLDRTFKKELKALNGDGSQAAKIETMRTARQCARELSTPKVADKMTDALRDYGRATVGICLAVTITRRKDRLQRKTVDWANEVMRVWTNRPHDCLSLYIDDNLHPTRIEGYAHDLIKYTTEPEG